MKTKLTAIAIRTGAWIGMISLLLFASPFSIPGTLIALFKPHDYPRYIGSALGLTAAVTMRLVMGAWIVRIGGASSGQWYIEIFLGCVSWALGSILVALSYWLASLALGRLHVGRVRHASEKKEAEQAGAYDGG